MATLFTTRWVGRLTDEAGKAKLFNVMSSFAVLTVVLVSLSAPFNLSGILAVTTLRFISINGCMVPGMVRDFHGAQFIRSVSCNGCCHFCWWADHQPGRTRAGVVFLGQCNVGRGSCYVGLEAARPIETEACGQTRAAQAVEGNQRVFTG